MMASFRPQTVVALVAAVFLLVALAVGAGVDDSGATVRRTGDTNIEALVGQPRFVNPLLAQSDTDLDLTHLVFSGLTRVDEHGNIVPDLADLSPDWRANPDAGVYTFTLRPDLLWSDGRPLTSDDVNFTLGLLRDPGFPGDPALAAPWRNVTVEAPNAQQVVFTLPAPDASFLRYTTLGILPRHLWQEVNVSELANSDLNTQPVGAGPWRYVAGAEPAPQGEQVRDGEAAGTPIIAGPTASGVLLEPNPNRRDRQAGVARLWLRTYPTYEAALAALRSGEAHGIGHIPQDRVEDVKKVPGVELHTQTLARLAMLLLNTRSPLLDDPRTRRAIELAINRSALIRQILHDEARVADGPILEHSWAYDPKTRHADYSPADARRLLDEAGWVAGADGVRRRNGEPFSLVLAANRELQSNVEVAREIQSQLSAAGIEVKLALVSRERLLRDYLAPGSFHLALVNWEAQGADPDVYSYWHSAQPGPSTLNFSGWSNPRADAALEAAHVSPEKSVRANHYADFQQVFKEDVPAVVLYSPLYTYATQLPAAGVALPATDMLGPACRFDTISDRFLRVGR